jgi:DNA-binding transcriptional LysR family regulator
LHSFRLVVFEAVAERLSFTQAAEILHVSQPAITSHIKALEDDLTVRLFERRNGKVTITPAGKLLQTYTKELHSLSEGVLRKIGSLQGEERGRLAIGASTTIAQYVLPKLVAEFLRVHPGVQVAVTSGNTQEIVTEVLERQKVLGLIEGPPGTADLRIEDFLEDEIAIIVAGGHPWTESAAGPTLRDLASEPLVLREAGSGTRRVVEDSLKKAGLTLRDLHVVMELDSTEAIKSGVEAGLGIGFVSRWALRNERMDGIKVIRIDGLRIGRRFQFVYPHGPEPDGLAAAFLSLARHFGMKWSPRAPKYD